MKKIAILLISLLFAITSFVQKEVYHTTKYIENGVERPANPNDVTFEFQRNDVLFYMAPNFPFRYRYSHKENGNSVYYRVGTEYSNMSEVIVKNSWLVFNSDKSVVNVGNRNFNVTTVTVYKRGSGTRSIGNMYE